MRLLRNRIDGKGPAKPQHIVLDTRLTVRDSCRSPQGSTNGFTSATTVSTGNTL